MGIGKSEENHVPGQLASGATGVRADGKLDGSAFNTMGNPGVQHWQSSRISDAGLDDRGDVFFAAVAMTRMPMIITDPRQADNPIVFANGSFLDLTGYSLTEVMGRNCRFLQGVDTDRETVTEIRQAIAEQRAIAVDILNYKADGRAFWNGLFIGPVFDHEGVLVYYFASQLDITPRLTSREMHTQAQKMEAIGQLTAGLAHDFNNLLQVAIGNQEIALLQTGNPDATLIAMGKSQAALEKASRLTQQLLTFARKQRLAPRRINVNAVVTAFSEVLHNTLGSGIDINLDLKPGLPSCELDPDHLEMALLNILINARDAMPQGGKVTIATAMLSEDARQKRERLIAKSYVVICVSDDGVGMAPEVARRATEPFFTTKGPGTGLGLAMVHGFVGQSRGRLEIDSEVGTGTTIKLIFPAASDLPSTVASPIDQAVANVPSSAPEIPVPKTILVVDDSDDVRELSEMFLGTLGYTTVGARSGEQALEMLEAGQHVDLLFTDVIMPGGMNGLQLVQSVQQTYPQIAVLAATGYMDELPDRARVQGPLDILTKPFKLDDLANKVGALLPHANCQDN